MEIFPSTALKSQNLSPCIDHSICKLTLEFNSLLALSNCTQPCLLYLAYTSNTDISSSKNFIKVNCQERDDKEK